MEAKLPGLAGAAKVGWDQTPEGLAEGSGKGAEGTESHGVADTEYDIFKELAHGAREEVGWDGENMGSHRGVGPNAARKGL